MDCFAFISRPKKFSLFINTTFIFLLSFYIITSILSPPKDSTTITVSTAAAGGDGCTSLHKYADDKSKCAYVTSQRACRPKGYINYLKIFYCTCGGLPGLGYAVLISWLVVLFYVLGNTASEYFCPSLEGLSKALKLSPTIAGTTLLPLGNGANDVFASIISFTRSGDGDVGFNSVLGGAFFVSSIVMGVISILISSSQISVDKPSFIRDVIFILFSLSSLLLIIMFGRVNVWGAICFVSIYLVYICTVSLMHIFHRKKERVVSLSAVSPSSRSFVDELGDMGTPLLGCVDEEKPNLVKKDDVEVVDQQQGTGFWYLDSSICVRLGWFLSVLELPLYLPRRLTIPMITEDRWSKPYAVMSVTLAPILLAALWNTQKEKLGSETSLVIYLTTGLVGVILGNFALVATKKSTPPNKCLLPWLAGGFAMSITWTYLTAEELVSLLVSLGNILGISPSILGLTVLAWGNSVGDLIANAAMAMHGGPDGVQIAVSGCYAGPLFNTLMGLGVSLVFASWSEYPSSYMIPRDPHLYDILGFLMAGLLWALVVLPKKNMKLDRLLGGGLFAIYFCFLFLRLARAFGLLNFSF